MAERQLDAVVGGTILNNDGGRGDQFRPTGQHEIPWWVHNQCEVVYLRLTGRGFNVKSRAGSDLSILALARSIWG